MGYVVKLEAYEVPFDLLLDLIEQNLVDILTYPLRSLEQYLKNTRCRNGTSYWGEFLVMAATLIRIG